MWPPVTHLVISEISLPETLIGSSGQSSDTKCGKVTSVASVTKNTAARHRVATVLLGSCFSTDRILAFWILKFQVRPSLRLASWHLEFWNSKFYLLWECSWPGVMLSVIQSTTPFSSYFGLLLARSSRYVGMGQWPLYLLNKCHMNRNVLFYWSGKGYRLYIGQSVGHWL